MKKFNYLILLFVTCSIITACGGDSDVDCMDGAAVEASFQDELNAANAAVNAFNADNSDDNCKALVDALNDYKDALKDIESCILEEELADFEAVLQGIEADLDSLNC